MTLDIVQPVAPVKPVEETPPEPLRQERVAPLRRHVELTREEQECCDRATD